VKLNSVEIIKYLREREREKDRSLLFYISPSVVNLSEYDDDAREKESDTIENLSREDSERQSDLTISNVR